MTAEDPRHILIVDDEESVRALLRECLEQEGYRVSEARDGAEAAVRLTAAPPHLVTLDLNLGGENGLDLARRIRNGNNVPIIMITAKGGTIDRVVGLELGADDYITKPFEIREVLARVRAVLRRYEAPLARPDGGSTNEAWRFGPWRLDLGRRELRNEHGAPRELTTAEFNLLALFVARPGRVLSRDNLMDLLKGHDWSPFDRSIDTLVVRLRKKIEDDPAKPKLIKTVRGIGYVFAAEVTRT